MGTGEIAATEVTSLVVGDSSDLGRAIVDQLLRRGDQVFGVSRSGIPGPDRPQRSYRHVPFDLGSGAVQELFSHELSGIGFTNLIYVAGFYKLKPLNALSDGAIDQHYSVNLKSMIDMVRFFISPKYSDPSGQRSITAITSIAHKLGEAGLVAYSSTKAAMVAAARSMAIEFADRNIRVNTVSPGWIESRRAAQVTDLIGDSAVEQVKGRYPLGFGAPEDVAYAVEFLTDDTKAKWITGIDLVVDGGRSCS